MAHRTVGAGQSIALTGTATTSSAFKVQSNVLRIVATGANAFVAIGTDPVATPSDYVVTPQDACTLAMLKQSQRVVGISTVASGTVLEAPEGTQMPFNIGDRVTLDYEGNTINDSNYTTLINDTKVVVKVEVLESVVTFLRRSLLKQIVLVFQPRLLQQEMLHYSCLIRCQ